jgi:hypothetical protein
MKRRATLMQSGSTLFARGVVYLVGIAALAVCLILLPELVREESVGKQTNPYLTSAFLGGAYVLATPFFIALYQSLKLLDYIDRNKAFTEQSIKTLRNIKYCAITFSFLIIVAVIVGISIARSMDPGEDVTAFVTLGGLFTFTSSIIAVFMAVLQKLLADAVALKSENDLIV